MQDFEKLGLFYLGREFDVAAGKRLDTPILYDSRDLVTHAVCAGMTGSGKTGLCLSLIEEAAIDGVPVIAIDPKGDLGNLLLTFPSLAAGDFRPWIDEDEARRAGQTPDAFAAQQAEMWRKGLADWGEDGARIERLRKAADFAIYTPGSRAGLPVSLLQSFAAPPATIRDDAELLGERAASTATSLLSLAGVDAPPRSREHTLVTNILSTAWKNGSDLDLAALIQQVQSPPFQKVGVVDLEAFFPQRERFDLSMRFNAVLAAPGFEQWFEGEPLDPAKLLYTADARPRVAVMSIAHLGDAERMFFVSLLLNQILGWMRGQTGTTSLRAVIYMDEIAGYFPPVANPPSKGPLLTLLKQGRAFGLGVVLATQNPVDLDYKGLSNIGTWFLGRLQTERDKARVLDGLEGAAAGSFDRAQVDRLLSALQKRVFLLHNVHEDKLVTFQTRWTLSYLRGPLSRDQIKSLMAGRAKTPEPPGAASDSPSAAPRTKQPAPDAASDRPPVLPPGIDQFFIPRQSAAAGRPVLYSPVVLAAVRLGFSDSKLDVDSVRDVLYAASIVDGPVTLDWATSRRLDVAVGSLVRTPEKDASFESLPAAGAQPKNYAAWEKTLKQWLTQNERIQLLRHRETGLTSRPEETEGEFKVRVQDASRAARDSAVDAIRQKYAARQAALAERLRKAQAAMERESEQSSQQKLQAAVSIGATLVGALFGRKTFSAGTIGRATTAARGVSRTMKESGDVQRASESVDAVRSQVSELDDQVRRETQAIVAEFDRPPDLEQVTLVPKRGQINVQLVTLGWDPDWMRRRLGGAVWLAALSLFWTGGCRNSSVPADARRSTRTETRDLSPARGELALPMKAGSVRFAIIGDSGRGDQAQAEVAQQMIAWRARFPFEFVVMLGDNIYPPHGPDDFSTKFEQPYRALLDAGVTFHAAIGNHDLDSELNYAPFNMGGRRYYTFRRNERRLEGLVGAGVRFFVLDSRSLDPEQLAWLRDELSRSGTDWKVCYLHHPIYTSGRYTSAARALRLALEPILINGDIDVVLSGHEHFYERLLPQHGISYFISGGAGSLRKADIRRPSPIMARGFDTDFHFMMMEVSGNTLYFQAISRTGETIDAGAITRVGK